MRGHVVVSLLPIIASVEKYGEIIQTPSPNILVKIKIEFHWSIMS
jgi:hypothetical protein